MWEPSLLFRGSRKWLVSLDRGKEKPNKAVLWETVPWVCYSTRRDVDRSGGHSQSHHSLKAPNGQTMSSPERTPWPYRALFKITIPVTPLLGEEYVEPAKMRIKACLADMLQ